MKDQEALMFIVSEMSKLSPYVVSETGLHCFFCGRGVIESHKEGCLFILARRAALGLAVVSDDETEQLKREIQADNTIISDYKRVLDVIPACPAHGSDCVPHAVEWVERVKTLGATITGFDGEKK